MVEEWNETARDYERAQCIHEMFEEAAQRRWAEVAVESGAEEISYGELEERGTGWGDI